MIDSLVTLIVEDCWVGMVMTLRFTVIGTNWNENWWSGADVAVGEEKREAGWEDSVEEDDEAEISEDWTTEVVEEWDETVEWVLCEWFVILMNKDDSEGIVERSVVDEMIAFW